MKLLKLFPLLLFLSLSGSLFSQFKLEEGPEYDVPKGYKFIDIHGYDESRFYAHHLLIHKVAPKVLIECYDSKNLNRLFAKEVLLPQEKGEFYSDETRGCHIEVRYLNKKNFIFYSFYNEDLRISNVYYITVDQDGNISSPNKIVSNCIRYTLLISSDKLHFGIISHLRHGKPKANDPNYNTFSDAASFDFYDASTMVKQFSKNLVDFTGNNKIVINNYQLNGFGTLSFFKKELDDSYIARMKKLELVIINPGSDYPFYHNFEFPPPPNYMNSTISSDLSITKTGKLCASFVVYIKDFNFLSVNSNSTILGKINFDLSKVSSFSQNILDLNNFIPLKTIEFGDNLYTIFRAPSKVAMISKIKKDGALDWSVPFPFSNQIADLALLSPYKILYLNNKINIYYIDHSENINITKLNASSAKEIKTTTRLKGSNLVCLSVEENGLARREVVYANEVFSAIPTHYADSDSYLNTHFDPFLENIPIMRLATKDKEKFARIK